MAANIVIGASIALAAIWAIVRIIRNKKRGGCSCGCGSRSDGECSLCKCDKYKS